jgi:hypothetical protein
MVMATRVTMRLPEDLRRLAKRKAADEGRSLASLIEEGLRRVLGEEPKPRQLKPIPVSSATGGLMPGIDISDSAALQETEDIEYIERLKNGFR